MKRLTPDNIFEMNMHQLALNQVYIGEGGWTQYVEGPDCECSVCDLVRAVSETLGVELPILSDEALSDLMLDWLQYGAEESEGVVAILYRALCAMAEVRDRLFRYEDTGLEPEEIKDVQEALKPIPFGRFRDIMEVERMGRLVVLQPNDPLTLEKLWEMDGRLVALQPNDPLTLEELWEMDGEPVWVVPMRGSGGFCTWMLVDAEYKLCREAHGEMAVFENYGKTWLAYRRKPEQLSMKGRSI